MDLATQIRQKRAPPIIERLCSALCDFRLARQAADFDMGH
jgi:hypothetical protein